MKSVEMECDGHNVKAGCVQISMSSVTGGGGGGEGFYQVASDRQHIHLYFTTAYKMSTTLGGYFSSRDQIDVVFIMF